MSTLNVSKIRQEVTTLIAQYEARRVRIKRQQLSRGKLYELYVLGKTLSELSARGYTVRLQGQILKLKQSPGAIQPSDAHFLLEARASNDRYRLYTDIEVRTLGGNRTGSTGYCSYHEIDIVVVPEHTRGRPWFRDVALGVECKSDETFRKHIVKQVLGVKREISLLSRDAISTLAYSARAMTPLVPSQPPLEFWLAFSDPRGNRYKVSPGAFGISFKHWRP